MGLNKRPINTHRRFNITYQPQRVTDTTTQPRRLSPIERDISASLWQLNNIPSEVIAWFNDTSHMVASIINHVILPVDGQSLNQLIVSNIPIVFDNGEWRAIAILQETYEPGCVRLQLRLRRSDKPAPLTLREVADTADLDYTWRAEVVRLSEFGYEVK